MNFGVYQIGLFRSFSELARAVAKCKDVQTLAYISGSDPKLVEDVNTSMPEIFMSEVTDLPFYHVILASEDIFGRLFLGSRTLRVVKSTWQGPGFIPLWASKLILESFFVMFIKSTLICSIMYKEQSEWG